VELANLRIEVSYNLFCEKHGKNSRDQHFSCVSQFIYNESMVKQLTSSKDICDAIERQQRLANINTNRRYALKKASTQTIFKEKQTRAFVVPQHTYSHMNCPMLKVDGLKKYYNFFTDNDLVLKTHFMSDQSCFEILNFKITYGILENTKRLSIDKVRPLEAKSDYLKSKMFNWKLIQRKKKNFINESEVFSDQMVNKPDINTYLNFCKVSCKECTQNCFFRLSQINDESLAKQSEINEELKRHGHPKSRKRNGINRTLSEAKSELKKHYLKFHFNNLE